MHPQNPFVDYCAIVFTEDDQFAGTLLGGDQCWTNMTYLTLIILKNTHFTIN